MQSGFRVWPLPFLMFWAKAWAFNLRTIHFGFVKQKSIYDETLRIKGQYTVGLSVDKYCKDTKHSTHAPSGASQQC